MAMGRLLAPNLNPHFSSRGFVPLMRRSSSSSLEGGRKFESLPDSKASANKDIGQNGTHWNSLRGLLTNLKLKILGNIPLLNKSLSQSSLLSKSPMVSPRDVVVEKVVSLHNVAEEKNYIPPSVKEESLVSEDASQCVAATEKRETTCVEKETLDTNCSLDAQEEVLQAKRVGIPQELDVSPKNKLSKMFINLHPDKPRLRFESLSHTNSQLSPRESSPDEVGQQRFSDSLPSGAAHDQKAAITDRKTTLPIGSCRGTVVPVPVSKDFSIKKLMESLHVPTNNGMEADATSWNPNGKDGKCVSKESSLTTKSDLFCAMEEEEESKGMRSQDTLAATSVNQESAKKSLDALSIGEHSPNRVMLRFLHEAFPKSQIVESVSEFGAVLDVQDVPSFEGCIYKDAFVTFETKSAVKKALKKGVVMGSAIVEAISQKNLVEKIRIPDLIGDPDAPISLVKEPTKTVKIHPLDHSIGSNQIREALGFCKSDISKIIFGSSKTAAFIEFETEDGKERALAAHSVDVLRKQLFISRIDIPRTTVARISNLSGLMTGDLRKLCLPYGQIKKMFHRAMGVADIHFDVSEWPNMLTILNSMNGKEVNGKKWVVRPATTVIPHAILKVLWEDPQGKSYVKGLIENMRREIDQPLDAAAVSSLCSTFED